MSESFQVKLTSTYKVIVQKLVRRAFFVSYFPILAKLMPFICNFELVQDVDILLSLFYKNSFFSTWFWYIVSSWNEGSLKKSNDKNH